jgi:hypothetical protein
MKLAVTGLDVPATSATSPVTASFIRGPRDGFCLSAFNIDFRYRMIAAQDAGVKSAKANRAVAAGVRLPT